MNHPSEFDVIRHLQFRLGAKMPTHVHLGIGDDAAIVQSLAGEQIIVTMDTLHVGVHFPPETAAGDLAWKSLAVNLSDLAAMGAEPRWCTLSLTKEQLDWHWLNAYLDGFIALTEIYPIAMIGGDTTSGPLSISMTAMGAVPVGSAIRRDGAKVGDDIWLTGGTGDAAAALWLWRQGKLNPHESSNDKAIEYSRQRLVRPMPRIREGIAIRSLATAAIDLSDGLVADLGHICHASRVAGVIDVDSLPLPQAQLLGLPAEQITEWMLGGGDDYELCFTAPPSRRQAISNALAFSQAGLTRIGRIVAGQGVRAQTASGLVLSLKRSGYQHFTSDSSH